MVVFDHIPKTAGTTFRKAFLKRALPAPERWVLSGGDGNERDRERFFELPEEQRRQIRVIAGHYAESLRPRLPEAHFVTVVRDPLARTISAYLHARYHEGAAALWPDIHRDQLPLREYVTRYRDDVADYQSRAVLGADCASLSDAEIEHRLNERYSIVGYTQAFDSFVFLLHLREGLPLALYTNRLVRPERATYVPSVEDVEVVRACTTTDARLRRIVKARFDAALAALPGEEQQRHRAFLEDLRRFRAEEH